MGDLGLQGAYAGDALQQLLAQRRAQATAMQQQQFQNALALRSANRADQQLSETVADRKAREAETARLHDQAAQNDQLNTGSKLADQIPAGFLPSTNPAVGFLRSVGAGSDVPATQPMGPDFQGPMPNDETPQQAQVGRPAGFLKTASQKQLDDAQRARSQGDIADIRQQMADIAQQRADAGPKEPSVSYQLQPEVDPATGKQTGRFLGFNTKANRFEPVGGVTPTATKAAPGAAQAAQADASKKEALGSLDQLDQAIESAKDLIGPGPGRVSHIEQLVGNPDPRVSALGTKLLLTKMQVDHAAAGTVRAGSSPQLLARWDNLLSQNLDAANLKAAVQAMREILGGKMASTQSAIPAKRVVYDLNGNPVKR